MGVVLQLVRVETGVGLGSYNIYDEVSAHFQLTSAGAFCTVAAAKDVAKFIEYYIINRIYNLMQFTFSTHTHNKNLLDKVINCICFL